MKQQKNMKLKEKEPQILNDEKPLPNYSFCTKNQSNKSHLRKNINKTYIALHLSIYMAHYFLLHTNWEHTAHKTNKLLPKKTSQDNEKKI